MILGGNEQDEEEENKSKISTSDYITASLLFLLNPILNATGSISLRVLKDLHDYTSSAYMGIAMTVLFALIIELGDMGWSFTARFDTRAWLIVALVGFIAVIQ